MTMTSLVSVAAVAFGVSALPSMAVAELSKQSELSFSQSQIVQYEALLGQLAERAETETDLKNIDQFKVALSDFEQKITDAKESRVSLQKAKSPGAVALNKEDLKNDLFAMQESARDAVGVFVDADNRVARDVRPMKRVKISAANVLGSGLNP